MQIYSTTERTVVRREWLDKNALPSALLRGRRQRRKRLRSVQTELDLSTPAARVFTDVLLANP